MTGFRPASQDLGILPRVQDSWTFLYLEYCRISQNKFGIVSTAGDLETPVPVSQIQVLMIGPGVSITSAAMLALADHGCSVLWVGEQGVRFYSGGCGLTRSTRNIVEQARLLSLPLAVAHRLYEVRFQEPIPLCLSMAQYRGYEGARVKQAYLDIASQFGITWKGRCWQRGNWDATTQVNKALSVTSSCLYGLAHAVIVSLGFSPALGFIHTGDQRSFALDIADLYRERVTIPIAFEASTQLGGNIEGAIRRRVRDMFRKEKFLTRMVDDIYQVIWKTNGDAALLTIDDLVVPPGTP